jgi:ATP-binding cassette subfamily C protein
VSIARKVFDLLTPREQRQALLLIPIVILMALAEVGGIAIVAPFLSLVSDPSLVQREGLMAWGFETFGFRSVNRYTLAVGVVVIIGLVLSNVILIAGNWVLFRFGALRNHTISRRLLIRYLQQPYSFFLQRNSAALANNILQEVFQIINGVVIPGLMLIAKGVAVITVIVFLVVLDPLLALLAGTLLGGAYGFIFLLTRNYLGRIGRERVDANQRRYQAANEAMGGIKDLRLLGREAEMVDRYNSPSRDFAEFQANSRIIGTVPRYALEAIAFGSIVAMVLFLLASGSSVGGIIPVVGVYAFAGYRLLPALQQVFSGATQIRYSQGALDEVHEMVARIDATLADADAFVDRADVEALPFKERIELRDVAFAYEGGEPVLRGLNFDIPLRASVAFVGTTGAGKTTLVDVILGLLTPTGGTLSVDGVTLNSETVPQWQKNLGYVAQSIYLTDDTVARNIALGLPEDAIDMDAVKRAADMAQVHRFIEEELPDGYATVVGERGVRLSGGQRQRIGIARALYHDPEVLVFDEATSALDGATERAVYEAIRELSGRKTILTIAHRLATVQDADTIFMLDRGRIVAQGSYDELLTSNDAFRRMADHAAT